MSNIKRKLIFTVLLAFASATTYADDRNALALQDDSPSLQDLFTRASKQAQVIDYTFEQIGFGVNNGSIKIENKNQVKDYIASVRKQITNAKREMSDIKSQSVNIEHIKLQLEINESLTEKLVSLTKSNLKIIPQTDEFRSFKDIKRSNDDKTNYWDLTEYEAKNKLDAIDDELIKIGQGFGNLGFSLTNRFFKMIEKINKNFHITTIAKRAIPYGLLGIYWVFVSSPQELPGYEKTDEEKAAEKEAEEEAEKKKAAAAAEGSTNNRPEIRQHWLQWFKSKIGGMPKKGKATRPKPSKIKVIPTISPAIANPVSHNLSDETRTLANEVRGLRYDIVNHSTLESDDTQTNPGILGTPVSMLSRFVKFDTRTFFDVSAAMMIAPILKKDAEDIGNWSLKQFKKAYAFLKGEPYEDDSPIKKSKITFKEVIGFDHAKSELGKVVKYFTKKDDFDRAGASVERGYLLVGQVDAAKSLAQALAGEVTNIIKEKKKAAICGVYEIHASQLLDKKLKDIIKEAEEKSPCILVIDQIDWLSSDKQVKPEIWSDLVTSMSSTLRSNKKEVFIIATAQNLRAIDKAVHEQGRLGVTIQLDSADLDARKTFIAKELTERVIDASQFDLELLAKQTEGCTLQELARVIKRAIAHAQEASETLNQKHIEISIDEVVHNIISTSVSAVNKKMLAAHFAGKAFAHINLKPGQLNKVTIKTVAKGAKLKSGAIIAYKPKNADLFMTQKDIENYCVIALAGAEAQKLIANTTSVALSAAAKKNVFDLVKKTLFEGISEKELPRNLKEQKLAEVWQIIDGYTKLANQLVSINIDKIKAIAKELETRGTISADELDLLSKNA